MIPLNIENWSDYDWDRKVYYCSPSGGGAVGVIFVWTKRANFNDPSTSDFVIKPIQGTAAPTKFAERILRNIGKAKSPKSKSVKRGSISGLALMKTLDSYRRNSVADRPRWDQVFIHYDKATTFLIQEMQSGMVELADKYREAGGLEEFLSNNILIQNLGRLFAADALIGNGDRLFSINTGNILFNSDGTFSAIDTATVLTEYRKVLEVNPHDFTKAADSLEAADSLDPKNRAKYVAAFIHRPGLTLPSVYQQRQIAANKPVALPMAFGIKEIFDISSWWHDMFKTHIRRGGADVPEALWESAFVQFRIGFEAGTSDIDRQLSGLNWLKLKSKYKEYTRRYGGDPNLNWDNFKIRRKYFKLLKKGVTAKDALTNVQAYAKKNMPGL